MMPNTFLSEPLWWEIAYIGGEQIRGSTREEWIAARQDGVFVVRQPVRATYLLQGKTPVHFTTRKAGEDYYWLDEDNCIQCGPAQEAAEAVGNDPDNVVKRGAAGTDEEFLAIYNAWQQDVPA